MGRLRPDRSWPGLQRRSPGGRSHRLSSSAWVAPGLEPLAGHRQSAQNRRHCQGPWPGRRQGPAQSARSPFSTRFVELQAADTARHSVIATTVLTDSTLLKRSYQGSSPLDASSKARSIFSTLGPSERIRSTWPHSTSTSESRLGAVRRTTSGLVENPGGRTFLSLVFQYRLTAGNSAAAWASPTNPMVARPLQERVIGDACWSAAAPTAAKE